MNEGALAEMLESPWLVAGVAFALGLFAGWMAWGGPWRDKTEAGNGGPGIAPAGADTVGDTALGPSATPDEKLGAILAEIHNAKTLLADAEDAETTMRAELDSLDQAVKRANGRLKLIVKSTDRATDSE